MSTLRILSSSARIAAVSACVMIAIAAPKARGQFLDESNVHESTEVLNTIMSNPNGGIPLAMLADAQAVAIVPRVLKGSFIVGARRGEGVVLIRDDAGGWQAPVFVTLTGGNVGWQIGVQSTDVVLVFKTRTSVEQMLRGTLTIGADAAAAAGPVGRNAAVATDGRLQAEVYSYSRSRGLFAGVSIDGSVLKMNSPATAAYYRMTNEQPRGQVPDSATQLVATLQSYCQRADGVRSDIPARAAIGPVDPTGQPAITDVDAVRRQLANRATEMNQRLDQAWQEYLALPAEVFQDGPHPSANQLAESVLRYDAVQSNEIYRPLTSRPEFQGVLELLRRYHALRAADRQVLALPQPPQQTLSR